MSRSDNAMTQKVHARTVDSSMDRTTRTMFFAVLGLVVALLSVLVYGLFAGILRPAAPRTAFEYALKRAERQIELKPGNGQYWAELAMLKYNAGDERGGWATIRQARKKVKDATLVYVNNAEVAFLVAEKDYEKAIEVGKKALAFDAEQRAKIAQEYARKGIKIPIEKLKGMNATTVQLSGLMGRAYFETKNYDKALESYDRCLLLDPGAADLLTARGYVHLAKKDYDKAVADFEQALKFIPDYEPAKLGLEQAKKAQKKS